MILSSKIVCGTQVNVTCSWGEPNSDRIDPFACYIRAPFIMHENDTLHFSSEIDATEIVEVNFWLPPNSRYHWQINFVPIDIFTIFPNLKSFTLPGRIESISTETFHYATNLRQLTIGNHLKVIPSNEFARLHKLEHLDLSSNKITTIQNNGFYGLISLRTLKLNRNHLRKLNSHTFNGAPLLEELLLNNNYIEHIEPHTFSLQHLKHLDLSHNRLKDLSTDLFRGCTRLEYLDLKSNKLVEVKQSLHHLHHLHYLDLDNNRIGDINLRMFAQLRHMEHLSLENNGPALNDHIFVIENSTAVSSKSVIKNLFLSGNELKNREILVRLWSLGMTQLEKLHLDNNAFEYIDFYAIEAFPKLKEIDLGQNNWKCGWLEQTLRKFEADGIEVNLFSSRFPKNSSFKHVNFIQCV